GAPAVGQAMTVDYVCAGLVTGEPIGTGDGSTRSFLHIFAKAGCNSITPNSVVVRVAGATVGTDDGAGSIAGVTLADGTETTGNFIGPLTQANQYLVNY